MIFAIINIICALAAFTVLAILEVYEYFKITRL